MSEAYRIRFQRVLDHIDAHLDEDLSIDRLSEVAAFSKFHFHRLFSAHLGMSIARYVQLLRLRRAAYQLSVPGSPKVIEVGLASGYESHEAFARAFKKVSGQTPSEFRAQPNWGPWQELFEPLRKLRSKAMQSPDSAERVQIVQVQEIRLAVLEHRGDPETIQDSIQRFIEFRKANHLHPSTSATYNLLYGDRAPEARHPPEDFRLDLGVATDRPIPENPQGVVAKVIPAGRCAVLRHVGGEDTLFEALKYLYATWLPESGEEPRDFPLYLQRLRFYPEVPEHQAVTDIFLPLT